DRAGETRLALLLAERHCELALARLEARARPALLLDRGADRGDLDRGRAAAAADDAGAERSRMSGELGEVVRGGMRIDDAAAAHAREPDVRQRRECPAVAAHLLERDRKSVV